LYDELQIAEFNDKAKTADGKPLALGLIHRHCLRHSVLLVSKDCLVTFEAVCVNQLRHYTYTYDKNNAPNNNHQNQSRTNDNHQHANQRDLVFDIRYCWCQRIAW
jgi:hypothetical protein